MTQRGKSKPKAQWCEEEVNAFLVYLQLQVSKIAGTTFKDETFNEAAKKLVGLQKQGPDKDMVQCKRKWQADNVNGANIQGEAAELQWNQLITTNNSNKVMKPFKNNGWRHWQKMSDILPNRSGAQGAAAYNPASLAAGASAAIPVNAEAGGSSLSVQASDGPITEASGSGLEVAAVPQAGWDQIKSALPSITPGVARSSMNVPPPSSSIAPSSMGKCLHSNIILSPSTAQTTTSLVDSSHASNVNKKPKLSTHGKSQAGRSHKGSRAAKDAASTAIFMNLQGSINSLTDSLRKSASNTDQNETGVLDERLEAVLAMQEKELISEDESVTLINMFTRSPAVCSIYLAAKPERRIPYLRSVLDQAARGEFGCSGSPPTSLRPCDRETHSHLHHRQRLDQYHQDHLEQVGPDG
ncbi:uncharacterized protein F5147DRAFT_657422 [Suillus discolor]|uniref:Myb/SANT-like domain-containing protein n=1 Tax=Suillus discolor TaxID=1912936 RepID=A0A9P7EVS0_9AGAM|nr:uncharacterized protein F5147DRAFT_657422 [Suillus discolor]KAG2093527.1 hypothetical protein F5147DRAFT_657422 [Suillus discolor]